MSRLKDILETMDGLLQLFIFKLVGGLGFWTAGALVFLLVQVWVL